MGADLHHQPHMSFSVFLKHGVLPEVQSHVRTPEETRMACDLKVIPWPSAQDNLFP